MPKVLEERVAVQKQARITIPPKIRRLFHIEEGDVLKVETRNGQIVLTPQQMIDAREEWFLSPAWQEGEGEADRDIREGRIHGPYRKQKDLLQALKK